MPDDNQTALNTNAAATGEEMSGADSAAVEAAVAGVTGGVIDGLAGTAYGSNNAGEAGGNSVNLQDFEYATPSAYIDPDIPSNPTPIVDPNEVKEEAPEEKPEEETIEMTPEQIAEAEKASQALMKRVAEKITEAKNILIALSSDPSVDELAAAIGMSVYLDRLGKHAIAIYSGKTPNALEFLRPEEAFETDADVLQDFVIALDKDKADHLRYKLEGDYVKIFITPYRDKISADDLEFSYGDYNVDLVLALNVDNGADLDGALREHGRIMHDATVVNITTGNPGKFGEIEWTNKRASSVSEMVAELLYNIDEETKLNGEEATALLTGIVAATDRFARANTFPATMQVASELLDLGADQQLVAANISDDLDNQFFAFTERKNETEDLRDDVSEVETSGDKDLKDEAQEFSFSAKDNTDEAGAMDTALKITHEEEEDDSDDNSNNNSDSSDGGGARDSRSDSRDGARGDGSRDGGDASNNTGASGADIAASSMGDVASETGEGSGREILESESSELLDELKATEASLSRVGEVTAPTPEPEPLDLSNMTMGTGANSLDSLNGATEAGAETNLSNGVMGAGTETDSLSGATEATVNAEPLNANSISNPEMVINPPDASVFEEVDTGSKYGKMMEEALNSAGGAPETAPMGTVLPPVAVPEGMSGFGAEGLGANGAGATDFNAGAADLSAGTTGFSTGAAAMNNPAASLAPEVSVNPEINGVPEINYGPSAEDQVLPPPPAPPVDIDSPMPVPGASENMSGQMPGMNNDRAGALGQQSVPTQNDATQSDTSSQGEGGRQPAPNDPSQFVIPGM